MGSHPRPIQEHHWQGHADQGQIDDSWGGALRWEGSKWEWRCNCFYGDKQQAALNECYDVRNPECWNLSLLAKVNRSPGPLYLNLIPSPDSPPPLHPHLATLPCALHLPRSSTPITRFPSPLAVRHNPPPSTFPRLGTLGLSSARRMNRPLATVDRHGTAAYYSNVGPCFLL